MKVVEDFSQTSKSTIEDLHYKQIPATFSGKVLFFTLDRKFINGYKYTAGQIIGKVTDIVIKTTGKQIQSVKTTLKVSYVCEVDDYWWWACTNGVCDYGYLYRDYIECEADDPNGGGVGGGGGGGGGGSTGGGGGGGVSALMSNAGSINYWDLRALDSVLNQMIHNGCTQSTLYNYLSSHSLTATWSVNSGISDQASYNPATNTLTVKDPVNLGKGSLFEELFHKYQNADYPGGTTQYLSTAKGNMEYEAKLMRDINSNINGGALTFISQDYRNFLDDITNNGASYPTSFTPSQLTTYFHFLALFVAPNATTGYANAPADTTTLAPKAIFDLVNPTSGPITGCPLH